MKTETEAESSSSYVTVIESLREIAMFGSISDETVCNVITALRQFDAKGKRNIGLVISSTGGDEGSGWAIYDALRLTRSKIIGQCFGKCMSIAALILQACDTRLLSQNCRFMIHDGTFTASGALAQVKNSVEEEVFLTQKYYKTFAERTTISLAKVIELGRKETFMSADKAVEFGFADGVLG
jgi:ATP-dependent Clp protease, protease subunit